MIVRDVQTTARKYYVTDGETRQGTHTNRQSKMRSQTNTVVVTPDDLAACPIRLGEWCHRADLSLNDLLPPEAWA